MSNGEQAAGDGRTLTVGGATWPKGIGMHADGAVHVYLGRTCRLFTAKVGVDAEVGSNGSVRFAAYGDGRLLGYTDTRRGNQAATTLSVGLAGITSLELRVTNARDGISYDHADWADARLTCTGTAATARRAGDAAWSSSSNGWGPVERNQSNGEQPAGDGGVITIAGASFPYGIGGHAASDVALNVTGCTRFTALAGVDAETAGRGSVAFAVIADGTTLYTSPTVTPAAPVTIDVPFSGRTTLHLVVTDAGDGINYDHADWGDAVLSC